MTLKNHITHTIFDKIAMIFLWVGTLASLSFVFYTGRNNASILLRLLFAIWVISPFIGLLVLRVVSKRWSVITRGILNCLILVISLGSLLGYSGVLNSAKTKPAFVFLVIPLISWLLIAVLIPISESIYRRKLNNQND